MGEWQVVVSARSFGRAGGEPMEILRRAGCKVTPSSMDRPLTSEELSAIVRGADALIVGNDAVDASVIGAAPRLRVISRYGAGVDNIDVPAATTRGIAVTNTPGANVAAVADLTVGLIIALARHIPDIVGTVRQGKWDRIMGFTLATKTVGVIGLGKIGRAVVERLVGFGVMMVACDVVRDDQFAERFGLRYVPLDDLLASSDFVTVHVPLTSQTRGLIGDRELSLMKSSAFIVNTSRGEVVDEDALYRALREKRIAGAALDVLREEPPVDNPLIALESVIVTSHIGGYTREAVNNMGIMAATNLVDVLEGRRAKYTVNPEVYDRLASLCRQPADDRQA
ncbi:MAG: phosphoglycerate dehydrogenase [Bacillota bacterium]